MRNLVQLFTFLGFVAAIPTEVALPTLSSNSATNGSCPYNITDGDRSPYAMVVVSKEDPDGAHKLTTTGRVKSNDLCTWFAFKAPKTHYDSVCLLSFTFPEASQMSVFSKYQLAGPGNFDIRTFFNTAGDANDLKDGMTWDAQPTEPTNASQIYNYKVNIQPNGIYTIDVGTCSDPLRQERYERRLFVRMCSADTNFVFPESTNSTGGLTPSCPVGMYILVFPKDTPGDDDDS